MKKFFLLIIFLAFPVIVFAGTKGKITGTITDAETGEALPGANVIIEGTTMGAATNLEGYYVILNVPPGTYRLRASMMGYVTYTVTEVRVNIDRTTIVHVKMKPTVLPGEEVVVVAERPIVQKDVAASLRNVTSGQIEALPVTSVTEAIETQPGIASGLSILGSGS
ncbi:MAG: carboxypeptidase-like regulatory domain-containing protein, partial [candidate division WOR-3 bacterium]|nr:carboxypeptidase-like regulatory domain-containing protein [candidate division WOR-3 bacterium]